MFVRHFVSNSSRGVALLFLLTLVSLAFFGNHIEDSYRLVLMQEVSFRVGRSVGRSSFRKEREERSLRAS